jgi:hypothetical protein
MKPLLPITHYVSYSSELIKKYQWQLVIKDHEKITIHARQMSGDDMDTLMNQYQNTEFVPVPGFGQVVKKYTSFLVRPIEP